MLATITAMNTQKVWLAKQAGQPGLLLLVDGIVSELVMEAFAKEVRRFRWRR